MLCDPWRNTGGESRQGSAPLRSQMAGRKAGERAMPRQGYLWPIQVVFLTFLIVGTIGLLHPRFFNKTQPMPFWVSVVLLVIATSAANDKKCKKHNLDRP